MKVVFIGWGQESLAIEYLSASLKEVGHTTELFFDPALFRSFIFYNSCLAGFLDRKRELINKVVVAKPDLIAFSVVSDVYGWALDIASELKKTVVVPIIFGGIHPSSVPEVVIKENSVDYVCVGEGEEAIVLLADAIETGADTTAISNIWAKDNGVIIRNYHRALNIDLDKLPFPDKDLYYAEYKSFVSDIYWIATSRGCLYNCSFCCHSFFRTLYQDSKNNFRVRSVENVITELKWAKEKFKIKKVCFVDDLFIADKSRALSLLNRYKEEINLPFACEVHPLNLDEDLICLLEAAGCKTVGMGIQTVDSKLRTDVLNRGGSNELIIKAIEGFQKTSIFLFAEIIIGLPGQDTNELLDIIRFFSQNKVDFVLPLWLRYYPKIEIIKKAQEMNILSELDIENIEEGKEFKPVSIKGNSFSAEMGRLYNLLLVSQVLPTWFVDYLIKQKIYRLVPSNTFLLLRLITVGIDLFKVIFSTKKRFMYLDFKGNIKMYLFYIQKAVGLIQ